MAKKIFSSWIWDYSPYIYETTFENEANSFNRKECSVLMGGIAGLFSANYGIKGEWTHQVSI